FKNWYNIAIRQLLGYYRLDPAEQYAYRNLANMVSPSISIREAKNAVKQMLKLGLLVQNKDGTICRAERFLSTGDEVNGFFVRKFQETMIDRAKESMDRFLAEQRDVSSLTVSVSDKGFDMLKSEIQLFRKRFLEIVKTDSDPQHVYQMNFQFFPLTNHKKMRNISE
ncbi:MAG: DUF4423 domain-containing protein, partial [Fibrobacteria bacterium]|nr:DUF4423 domain-containing protein [Fibrobacteria bacterium]